MCFGGSSGGGGGSTTTQTNEIQVPGYISDAQKNAINAGKAYATSPLGMGTTPQELAAYQGITNTSNYANSLQPMQAGLIEGLYGGGGMGQGMDYINNAFGQANQAYQPYLQSNYLDPMSNPYLQPAIESARAGAFGDVADRFHKAGRSFSGAEAGAFGTAATNTALPMLLNQYNTNVGQQQGAAQGLLSGALGASTGLNSAQQGVLQAMMSAPGQLQNMNSGSNMQLDALDRQRQVAKEAINARTGFLTGLPTSQTSTGTSTTTNQTNPFQAILGGGLGLLGLLM